MVLTIENLAVVQLVINEQQCDLSVREFKSQRVVTLKDVDVLHQRVDGTARRNFNDNRKHFVEDEDFFVRNPHEAKTGFDIVAPRGLVLLTESGYLMLVKSFTDDLAWQVQRQLVKHYFRIPALDKPANNYNLEAAISLFNQNAVHLAQPTISATFNAAFNYLWKELTNTDLPCTAMVPTVDMSIAPLDRVTAAVDKWYLTGEIAKLAGVSVQKVAQTASKFNLRTGHL